MNLLQTPRGRAALFALLYASEGAPIGFIWWSLPTLMRERGGEVGRITTVLAAVAAMWALKFLWAPLVDVLRGPRWGFRSWILSAQLLMGLTLLPLAWLDPVADMQWLLVLLIAHALCATLQDVAIDALAINVVPREELGRLNGFMAAGKYLGRGLFGGVALIVAARLGWQWIIFGMVGCIWAILWLVRLLPEDAGCPEPSREVSRAGQRLGEFFQSLRQIMQGSNFWLAIGFALVAGAGFEAVGALCGTYLPDRGVSTEATGWFRAVVVVGAMIGGGLLGGVLTDRWGVRRASLAFLLGLAGCNLILSLADSQAASVPWLLGLIAVMYFGYGMFISASYALFMSLTESRVAATQFSVFMAATNGCEVWSGWLGGQVVERAGYAVAFCALSAISLAALPALMFLSSKGSQRGAS
jgi:MFS family permease